MKKPFLDIIILKVYNKNNVLGAYYLSLIRNWVKCPSCPSNRIADEVSICHCISIWEGETKDDVEPVDLPIT